MHLMRAEEGEEKEEETARRHRDRKMSRWRDAEEDNRLVVRTALAPSLPPSPSFLPLAARG